MKAPHIILLTADQMRFDCLSCYGNLNVRTPHLDALAAESVVFDRAYCATPLCVPTRTCIGTGLWPHSTRAIINSNPAYPRENIWGRLGPEYPTFYERLDEAGYAISHVGIQHIHGEPPLEARVPRAHITDSRDHEDYMRNLGLSPTYETDLRVPVPDFDNGRLVAKPRWVSPRLAAPYPHDPEHFKDFWFTRRMEAQIAAGDPSRPNAFIFQGWAPRPPFFVPEPYFSMYRPEEIELPENVGQWYDGMPPTILLGSGGYRGSHMQREDWRPVWAAYFGLVTLADACLGRVIQALKAKGIWDEALVIFTMDHGEAIGSHRMFEKMTMYEESAHVPLFVKPPGGARSGRRKQLVGHADLAPTICDYAGARPLDPCWGESLRPLVDRPDHPGRPAIFCEFNGDQARAYPQRAIISGRYKYIHHFCADPELYDLEADPQETRSLAKDPAHQERCRSLRGELAEWMRATDDILDVERDAEFTPADWARITR